MDKYELSGFPSFNKWELYYQSLKIMRGANQSFMNWVGERLIPGMGKAISLRVHMAVLRSKL